MKFPIEAWMSSWQDEKALLMRLPFVVDEPIMGVIDIYSNRLPCVYVNIKVDLPANGPVCEIQSFEEVAIVLWPTFPFTPPSVLVRHNFPPLPHLGSRKEKYREICLTRQDKYDWWQGKTFDSLLKDIYDWLCDAAAGKLIKDDDPFEPLIGSGNLPVEINTESAKQNCAKHDGSWLTESEALPVKNGNYFRFCVSSKGGIPTQVWYQKKEQSELWLDPPSDIEELLVMTAKVGFDSERIRYWIGRGKTQLLLVFGIRRPKEVLGRANAEEWIAFYLSRKKAKERCEWSVSTHIVLESFNTIIASMTSGFENQQKKVLLIGAGAIGSEIAEALTRSGTVHLTIIDNDSLRPHNLARHALYADDLGEYKSVAVANKLNSMFSTDVCESMSRDFLGMTSEELQDICKDVDLVINASASLAVQSRLPKVIPSGIPAMACFQINRGTGTVLLYSPDINVVQLDVCEAMLITNMMDSPFINRWFDESAETMNIGGGCRSATSKIAGSVVKFGGGWLADKILRHLNSDNPSKDAFVEILEYNYEEDGRIQTHVLPIEQSSVFPSCDWTIITNKSVIGKINQMAEAKFPDETGGVMIGRLDRQKKIAIITEAWGAPKDSKATSVGFSRGLAGLKSKIALLESDTNDYLSYIGEWHSHPPGCKTGLSPTVDSPTAKRMAAELEQDRIPAICLITNAKEFDTHVVNT